MIAFGLAILLAYSSGVLRHADTRRPAASLGVLQPISVAVFAPPDIKDSLLDRICDETEAIWGPAGITFEWHRISWTTPASDRLLDVTFDDNRRDLAQAMGWIDFTSEGPEKLIHLSRASVESLLVRTPGLDDKTVFAHERLVGRALGRALSHELGHYLFNSKAHSAHGLMRAAWPSTEFFAMGRSGFALTATERAAAIQHFRQDRLWEPGS